MRQKFSLENAPQILSPFNLKLADLPDKVPYMVNGSLRLPGGRSGGSGGSDDSGDDLTSKRIRQIAVAACIWDRGGFSLADLLIWLKTRPEHRETYEFIKRALEKMGMTRRTLYNYESVARTFPPESRKWKLTLSHYDRVRALPRPHQRELLDEAVKKNMTAEDLSRKARIRKQELAMPARPGEEAANRALIVRAETLLGLRRVEARIPRICKFLANPNLSAQEANDLRAEMAQLLEEVERAKVLLNHSPL